MPPISHIDPGPYNPFSKRIAILDVAGERLASLISVLNDVNIHIVGSMAGIAKDHVRLIVQGEALPAECECGSKIIKAQFCIETYGSQSLTKIHCIEIVGEWSPSIREAA